MKKLMTILVVFALCGTVMAASGNDSALKQIPLDLGKHEYVNFQDNNKPGTSGLYYYASSTDNKYNKWNSSHPYQLAHAYFKTISAAELAAVNQNPINVNSGKKYENVVVQFVGTQADSYGNTINADWINDYGIYLLDENQNATAWYSVKTGNTGKENNFVLGTDQAFGVYYKTIDGKTITTTGDWVANRDTGNAGNGKNTVLVYNEGEADPHPETTYRKYMCLLDTKEPTEFNKHWEFMLQTTLDTPHYEVKPENFGGNGETFNENTASGQPLPGTLATLLIGGLCAKTLSKKNKKH